MRVVKWLKRLPTVSKRRNEKSRELKNHRRRTRNASYGIYNTSWATIKWALSIDLDRVLEKPSPVIVDLGCGNGRALRELSKEIGKKANLIGVSVSRVKEWDADSHITYRVVPFHKLSKHLPHEYADLVYSYYGAFHEDLRVVAKNVYDILKPEGLFILNVERDKFKRAQDELKKLFRIKRVITSTGDSVVLHLEKIPARTKHPLKFWRFRAREKL
jgi:SAM-dependent methyltransferase